MAAAAAYRKSGDFVDNPAKLKSPMVKVVAALDRVDDAETINLGESIASATGAEAIDIVKSEEFVNDKRR